MDPVQIELHGAQVPPLIRVLLNHPWEPGAQALITQQGDGSLIVGLQGETYEITTAGTVFEA